MFLSDGRCMCVCAPGAGVTRGGGGGVHTLEKGGATLHVLSHRGD